MQIQADLINADVIRPKTETTALGAAFGGIITGFWPSINDLKDL